MSEKGGCDAPRRGRIVGGQCWRGVGRVVIGFSLSLLEADPAPFQPSLVRWPVSTAGSSAGDAIRTTAVRGA